MKTPKIDVLPFPDAIEEPVVLDADAEGNDEDDDINGLIAALENVKNRFDLEDYADKRNLEKVKGPLARSVITASESIFRASSAKQIQDEKLAKKEKKRKEKLENGVKQKKHKKNKDHSKEKVALSIYYVIDKLLFFMTPLTNFCYL